MNKLKPQNKSRQLYCNLFEDRTHDESLDLLSDGLVSVKENAKRLVNDAQLLLKSKRFASARFLLSTADEEIAKAYMLLDMCRLDFSKQVSPLKCLCRAFYDHMYKYAYNKIHRFERFRQIHDLSDAKEIWDVAITKFWPSDLESGEPNMPHENYFLREAPLYVDYIEYDQSWFVPNDENERFWFEKKIGASSFSITLEYLEKLEYTSQVGLFESKCLKIFNNCFKIHYMGADWNHVNRSKVHTALHQKLVREYTFSDDAIINSIYYAWPLYHFLTLSR